MLNYVGIREPETRLGAYPHQLSGGQRQRIMIAMALANRPDVLIADEPTTALDVTIQAQILELLAELKVSEGMGLLFITHDLAIVRRIADRVCVMKDGEIVETGSTAAIFANPQPYTKSLLAAVPRLDVKTFKNESFTKTSTIPLVTINRVSKTFTNNKYLFFDGWKTNALNEVSLEINYGETVALVGESGSGKSTLGRAIVKLVNIDSGNIVIDSSNINSPNSNDLRKLRSNVQIIFQDPYSSLDPRFSVGRSIAEPILIQKKCSRSEVKDRVSILLKSVGLNNEMASRYPHEFSGGQRQRVAIARALASEPKFIVADEPTSALDVTIQAQILELLINLKKELHKTIVFITHDLDEAIRIGHRIAIMKDGIIEQLDTVLGNPHNAYTKSLLDAAPYPDPEKRKKLKRKSDLKSFNTGPLIEISHNHWAAS